AFHCPVFLTGVDYVGAHYHFLSDDHIHGGHVIDFAIVTATIAACEATSYTVDLPQGNEFTQLDLTPFHRTG
ncbi:MAG: acetolactate decarboxylase, partial [Candidatus Dormibacteraceae bacterium]